MHAHSLGYIPFLRPGALLFTAIVYQYLAAGRTNTKDPIQSVYGRAIRTRNLFGMGASTASERLFNGSLSPHEILNRHTLFGIYSRALSHASAKKWADLIVTGDKSDRANFEGALGRSFRCELGTSNLRSCRDCITQDTDLFGFAAWDVLHLLPAIQNCPRHGTPLSSEAEGRPGRILWELKLPLGRRSSTIATLGVPPSDGYAHYLALWIELFEGRLSVVASDSWPSHVNSVLTKFGSVRNAANAIRKSVLSTWGLGPAELSIVLGPHIDPAFIQKELEHKTSPSQIAQKLVMLTALHPLGIVAREPMTAYQAELKLPTTLGFISDESSLQAKVQHEVLEAGFPAIVIPLLMTDTTINAMALETGIRFARMSSFVRSLSAELLEQMFAHRSWPSNSWLSKEISRRRTQAAHD